MILACPTCHTHYKVEDEAISRSSGRTVRCASCGHSWHYMPAPVMPSVMPSPVIPSPGPTPLMRLRERVEAASSSPELPSELSTTPRPAITAPNPPRRGHSGLGWVVLILLIGAVIVGAIFARDLIIVRWPIVARYYDMIGLKTEPLGAGLDIGNVTSTRNPDGLIVEGDITNKTGTPHNVPHLRVALRDGSQKELVFKIIDPPRERLLPGETSHFVVGFLPAPDAAAGVLVTFVAG
jgi:predicted Zn finger-like uncharacterized protein